MPSVDAGGTELFFTRSGRGEPLPLIQGMSATHMTWGRPLLAPLGELRVRDQPEHALTPA